MIVAITIIIIVAMICATISFAFYVRTVYQKVNQYTLNDVRNIEEQIRESIRHIEKILYEDN